MQTISLPPQVPILLPVRQLNSNWVASLLVDHLSNELWRCYTDEVIRAQLPAPHGAVDILQFILQNIATQRSLYLVDPSGIWT